MEDNLLKGNFEVKKPIKLGDQEKEKSVGEELKKRALGTLGGSMVYMERKHFTWDGDE
ncbi:MAG: hypothetical protein JW847_09730 [Candidatus Omnitrophica bacterium]|nr:hypothetical protein [Candidatus Omnitrophota bacterium]